VDTPLQTSYFPRFATLTLPRRPRSRSMCEEIPCRTLDVATPLSQLFSLVLHSPPPFLFLPRLPLALRSACRALRERPFRGRPEARQRLAKSRAPVKLIDWPETCRSRAQGGSRRYRTKGHLGQKQRFAAIDQSRALSPANPACAIYASPLEKGKRLNDVP
jgi:hypothetical protein